MRSSAAHRIPYLFVGAGFDDVADLAGTAGCAGLQVGGAAADGEVGRREMQDAVAGKLVAQPCLGADIRRLLGRAAGARCVQGGEIVPQRLRRRAATVLWGAAVRHHTASDGPRVHVQVAGGVADVQRAARDEDDVERIGRTEHDAAANAERGGRRADRGTAGGADLAADEAEHPLRHRDDHLARRTVGVVDEAVDDHFRIRSDGQGRLVEEQDLRLAGAGRDDPLLEDDVLADEERAGCAAGRRARRVRIDGRGRADARGVGRLWRHGECRGDHRSDGQPVVRPHSDHLY